MIDFRASSMKTTNWIKVILAIVVVFLVISNILFISKYVSANRRAGLAEAIVSKEDSKSKVLDFAGFFIEKVLQAKGEISFDDRLIMETAVRDLKDLEIATQWKKFVQSSDERVVQIEVTNLLKLLVDKARK
ncbi:MAG: hypothetical protein AAB470_01030 [Patescibacteria group bacterium]